MSLLGGDPPPELPGWNVASAAVDLAAAVVRSVALAGCGIDNPPWRLLEERRHATCSW